MFLHVSFAAKYEKYQNFISISTCTLTTDPTENGAVSGKANSVTVELQWLEHRWLVYHDCFKLVLD